MFHMILHELCIFMHNYLQFNSWDFRQIVYWWNGQVETNKVFLRDTSVISPYSILLFGGSINVQHQVHVTLFPTNDMYSMEKVLNWKEIVMIFVRCIMYSGLLEPNCISLTLLFQHIYLFCQSVRDSLQSLSFLVLAVINYN